MHRSWMARWTTAPALLAGLALGAPEAASAETPSAWPRALGGPGREVATAIAVDGQGSSYVTGHFQEKSTFGAATLAAAGLTDVFVARIDRQGEILWARSVGGPGADEGRGIAVTPQGEILVTGLFSGTADFDPGPGRTDLASAGAADAFLLRLSPGGDLVHARRLGGTLADTGLRVAAGGNGEALLAGSFQGSLEAGARRLDSAGQADAFAAKLDAAGEVVWARRIGGAKDDDARGIVAGRNGEVWVLGNFEEQAGFGPEGGSLGLQSAGKTDIFVLRLDAAGTLAFSGRMGGEGKDAVESAAATGLGGIALGGQFERSADFDPGSASLSMAAVGSRRSDTFTVRLEGSGRLAWARQLGGGAEDRAFGVAGDREGSVTLVGYIGGEDDFAFAAHYSAEGKQLWSLPLRSSLGLDALAVAADSRGTPHVAGSFRGETAPLPETGAVPVKAAGQSDAFVWRLVPKGPARPRP